MLVPCWNVVIRRHDERGASKRGAGMFVTDAVGALSYIVDTGHLDSRRSIMSIHAVLSLL